MFTFNGTSSKGKLKVIGVTRSILPPSSNKVIEFDDRSGGFFVSKKYGMKQIIVSVMVIGANSANMRARVRDIAGWLDTEQPEVLIFDDEPNMRDFAILDGSTDLEEELKLGTGSLTFICPDPFSFGSERTVNLTTNGTTTVANAGTAETFPVVRATVTAPANKFTVTRKDSKGRSEQVTVNHAFATGDVLEIDMSKGKVSINGNVRMASVAPESDFWDLKKGNNTVDCPAGFTATVRYTERFK